MSIAGEIEKLETMRREGTLTDEEFAAAKRRVLESGRGSRRGRSFTGWRFIILAVLVLAAAGVLAWTYFGARSEPDPTLSLVLAVVMLLGIAMMRPFSRGLFGGDFGGSEDTALSLAAIVAVGAGVIAGGAFLIGLPLVAVGIAVIAVAGFVMWCWNALFGE